MSDQKPETRFKRIEYSTTDNKKLVGILGIPDRVNGFALLTHGINVDKNEYGNFYSDLADALYEAGVASLRFDFRGHGESGGTSMDVSIVGDEFDINASIAQIRHYWLAPILFVATSFGAGPMILVADRDPSQVKGLVLIAPVLDYKRTFLEPVTPWAKASFNPKTIREAHATGYIFLDDAKLNARILEEFANIRPDEILARSDLPTLIIHGDKDSMVPYSVSKAVASTRKNIQLVTIRNGDHGYPDINDETEGSGPKSLANKRLMIQEVIRFATG